MSEESQNNIENETDASYLSFLPGQRLKKARELRGLSIAQVAKELHMSERYIEAMESDDYKHLPEPAFVRGYMRRYAQLVKLSADDIAAKFDECYAADNTTPEPDARPRNPIQLLGDLKRTRIPWRAVASIAAIALLVAVIASTIFWRIGSSHNAVISAEPAQVSTPAPAPAATSAPLPSPPANSAAPAATLPTPAAAATVLPTPQAPAVAGTVLPTPAPAIPVAAASTADTLVLTFKGDCWISIKDGSGREVASGIRKAGETVSLSGAGPYNLNIGNAPLATVEFNGKPVDLKPYTQGYTANLKLAR